MKLLYFTCKPISEDLYAPKLKWVNTKSKPACAGQTGVLGE